MSKLSFRARALDPSKQMPIYLAEELPDLPEYSAINRAVPQMPSGMEKEEESEHHLQRAICTGLIIPTPEVYTTDQDFYDRNYPPNYRMPRQVIHMEPLGLEQDVPEYDMDSEDELWMNQQRKRLDLTPLKFEQMMDRLEKSSGQTVVTLNEAKALLKQDDEVSIAVYDYWLNKRLKMQHPLILSVKTENRPGASSNNPYLAFRRRTEKMQTRKNRKNDETSYEKMLKLRRDLQRATTVLEMVKRREKTKREQLHLSIEIFEKRVQLKDYGGALLSELSLTLKNASRPAFAPLYANQYSHHSSSSGATPTAVVPSVASSAGGLNNVLGTTNLLTPGSAGNVTTPGGHLYSSASSPFLNSANLALDVLNASGRKEKRQYKKRKHKVPRDKQQLLQQQQQHLQQQQQYLAGIGVIPTSATTGAVLVGNIAGGVGSLTNTVSHPHLPHHMQHLHRQSSSPAPNESNIETEEEDLAHKIGSESEDEAPFAFRRKQGCDYLRTRIHSGNWPWEPKEDYGFGDTKYRYTLTSIRHPRPRCVGFARRRMGRGGRVLLDRVATNFDDLWSHFDYTILDTKTLDFTAITSNTTTTNQDTLKPASPPTVVDLVPQANIAANHIAGSLTTSTINTTTTSVNNANTPAIAIKKEITEIIDRNHTNAAPKIEDEISHKEMSDDLEGLEECEYEYSDDENDFEDEFGLRIQRDRRYHSCVSMIGRRRLRKRSRQQDQHEQQQKEKKRKRTKTNSILQQKNMELVTRKLLYKLSQTWALSESGAKSDRTNNLLDHTAVANSQCITEIKQEKLNGLNKDDQALKANIHWLNNRCPSVASIDNKLNNINNNNNNNNNNDNNSSFVSSFTNSLTGSPLYVSNVALNVNSSNNNNNNNSSSNVNKNISNGRNSSCSSLSDKINVIKAEVHDLANEDTNIMRPCTTTAVDSLTRTIKQELIDSSAASICSADDSNEPLSSIQKLNTTLTADMMEDEENVNLAQLSNLIKIKKEVFDESDKEPLKRSREMLSSSWQGNEGDDDDEMSCLNQMADVIRVKNMKRHKVTSYPSEGLKGVNVLIEDMAQVGDDNELSMLGGLSPTSSQRLEICNELLSEIRRDWLHFRPKTPTETEKEESYWNHNMDYKLSSPLVDWSQHTPITIEMVREPLETESLKSSVWKEESSLEANSAFISSAFKYEDLEADTQLLQNAYVADLMRGSSKSPETNNSAACLDLNFSGDSLNDINLLGDGDDTDMLDNILQEVQIDDIKTLNQATNFWNGILDGENVDAEVDGDVEVAAELLEGIDDTKKSDRTTSDKKVAKVKGGKKSCSLLAPVGSSTFNCLPLEKEVISDESFFKKEEPRKDPDEAEEVVIKSVPKEVTQSKSSVVGIGSIKTTTVQKPQLAPIAPPLPPGIVNLYSQREVIKVEQQQQRNTIASPVIITQTLQQQHSHQPQQHIQQQQQRQHHQPLQQQPKQHLVTHSTSVQVIGNTISLQQNEPLAAVQQNQQSHQQLQPAPTSNIAPQNQTHQHHQQPQQQLTTIQVLQQPTTQQIRNVTVQQLHQLQLQQQQQRKLQLQQQKLLFPRDLVNTSTASVIAQYVPTSTSSTPTTIMRQPSLTPIGASSVNNAGGQMIYTTTSSGDVIAAGSPKIYLQKAPVSVTSGSQGVNIINTSSGQQLTVQNIAGVQHITTATGGNASTTTGPLIVTTSARNAVQQLTQQQQQQLVGQPTQQIVWRQIGSTNVTTTPGGMLAGTATTDGTVATTGNKIVWTSRPAQKRQLNGPESTDISKLLLNRKFSQRKIVQQQPQLIQQQQPQLLQQQQQQQQQSQDEDLSGVSVTISGQDTTTTAVSYNTQQQHQQQIQKLSGGKVIKMPSFPLLVSEVNLQQQQQQQQQQQLQQKHNTAAAIAANHNYSLQPTAAIITSQATSAQGNKIYLTTSSSGGAATNFTITNASELQTAAQKLQQANNSNLKLNFVATNSQQQSLQQQHQQTQQTVVVNKAAMHQQQLLPQQLLQQTGKLKRERILNIIGAAQVDANTNSTVTGATVGSGTGDSSNKRVLYTSLLNVKQLPKNNAGQMQVQIGPQGMAHAVLRSRIANNQAIFANMRTVPVATVSAASNNSHNNTTSSSSLGAGTTTTLQVLTQSAQLNSNINATTTSMTANLNTISNNNNNSDGNLHMQQQHNSSSTSQIGGADINSSPASLTSISHSASDLKSVNNVLNIESVSAVVTSLNNSNSATATVNSSGGSSSNGSSGSNSNMTTLTVNSNNIQTANNNNNNNSNTTTINR